MLKQLFLSVAIITSVTGLISCSQDEPDNGGKDPIEKPSEDPKDDQTSNPTDDGTIIVNADGTTSNGMQFRRVDETHFMLNYVKYWIRGGHLEVTDHDEIEVLSSLKGKVTIVPAVVLDGTKYYTRCIYGFSHSKAKEIELPNTITEIQDGAFSTMQFLEKIRIPESVTRIGSNAFAYCTSLRSIEFNKGLESLGSTAFLNCYELETISLPENVCIYEGCFYNVSLKELRLPKSFKIETSSSPRTVFNSLALENIYVDSKNPITPEGGYDKLFDYSIISNAYLNVPEGCSDLYKKSPFWGKFRHIVEYKTK